MQSTNSKQVKVVSKSQKYSRGDNFLIRSTENSGEQGNPFSAIGINANPVTNFRSGSAMRGAEFHGNTRRDTTTRILSIQHLLWVGAYLYSKTALA